MLRIGLSGGIGSGKSTVARACAERGATIVDADAIARGVLAPGGPGLDAVLAAFGEEVAAPDGSLDRAALAARVFADAGELARLEAITHPLIWAEAARQFAAAPADGIVVHDMPLLVEKRMSAEYHLVVIVLTDAETRVRRLVAHRGLTEDDARARIRAQASDADRRAAADVLLTNNGPPAELTDAVARLWAKRIEPYAANLTARRPAAAWGPAAARGPASGPGDLGDAGDAGDRAGQGRRIASRVRRALGVPADGPEPSWGGAPAARPELHIPLPAALRLTPDSRETLAAAGYPVLTVPAAAAGEPDVRLGVCDPAWPVQIVLSG